MSDADNTMADSNELSHLGVSTLFEDAWLLAIDKPAGIIVHDDGTGAPTLTDLARGHLEAAGEGDVAAQLQAVQRLDRDTTGVVLFSKDKAVQPKLDAALAGRVAAAVGAVTRGMPGATTASPADAAPAPDARLAPDARPARKRYLVVVRGEFPWKIRTLDGPIGRDRHDARRMRVSSGGKPAETRVRRLATSGARDSRRSLLLVELVTGRKHQIRVHLAHAGFPILGDALYGTPADRGHRAPALMLHAFEERLPHPVTGEPLVIRTSYPERFAQAFPDGLALAEAALAQG